jgi:hypothetical protein
MEHLPLHLDRAFLIALCLAAVQFTGGGVSMKKMFFVACIYLTLSGCGTITSDRSETNGFQRFLPIAPTATNVIGVPWHGYLALDSKTGLLCKTVSIQFGENTVRDVIHNLPECSALRVTFPDYVRPN